LWNLASDVPALSAHVVLRGEMTLHDAQASGDRLKALLDERFGIEHSTLELECHPCAPAPDEHQPRVR
jgi:cobalt-zinc-cadmium efflux system protein